VIVALVRVALFTTILFAFKCDVEAFVANKFVLVELVKVEFVPIIFAEFVVEAFTVSVFVVELLVEEAFSVAKFPEDVALIVPTLIVPAVRVEIIEETALNTEAKRFVEELLVKVAFDIFKLVPLIVFPAMFPTEVIFVTVVEANVDDPVTDKF
jgi:hypothetical protein